MYKAAIRRLNDRENKAPDRDLIIQGNYFLQLFPPALTLSPSDTAIMETAGKSLVEDPLHAHKLSK